MPINFPNSPSLNQTYTVGDFTWKWNGIAWDAVSTTVGPTGPQGATGPQGPVGDKGGLDLYLNQFYV